MANLLAANAVLLLHFAIVLFAVFGAVGLLFSGHWTWLHLPVVIWSSVVNLAGWTCPLTPMENRFRAAAGRAGYDGGFIQHYIGPIVYPGGMPRRLELMAGISILVWNGLLYAGIMWWLSRDGAVG